MRFSSICATVFLTGDLEEIMAERGVDLEHATLNRWVRRYAGLIAEAARHRKRPADRSCNLDERAGHFGIIVACL